MFQGDHDVDVAIEVQESIGVRLIGTNPGDVFCTIATHPDTLEEARTKLDKNLGTELMKKARNKKLRPFNERYDAFVLAAIMMHVGAKLNPKDREYLKSIYPNTAKHVGYRLPIGDDDFRKPGAMQVNAALENYVDGQPRSFSEPW